MATQAELKKFLKMDADALVTIQCDGKLIPIGRQLASTSYTSSALRIELIDVRVADMDSRYIHLCVNKAVLSTHDGENPLYESDYTITSHIMVPIRGIGLVTVDPNEIHNRGNFTVSKYGVNATVVCK